MSAFQEYEISSCRSHQKGWILNRLKDKHYQGKCQGLSLHSEEKTQCCSLFATNSTGSRQNNSSETKGLKSVLLVLVKPHELQLWTHTKVPMLVELLCQWLTNRCGPLLQISGPKQLAIGARHGIPPLFGQNEVSQWDSFCWEVNCMCYSPPESIAFQNFSGKEIYLTDRRALASYEPTGHLHY